MANRIDFWSSRYFSAAWWPDVPWFHIGVRRLSWGPKLRWYNVRWALDLGKLSVRWEAF